MESFKYIILTVLAMSISLSYGKPAEKAGLKCNGQDLKLTEQQMMNKKECLKDAGVEMASELTKEKTPCFIKCVFVKSGLVDDKGIPHKENIMKDFGTIMPDDVKKELQTRIEKCLDESAAKIDPNESSCNSYMPLGECMHSAFTETCKS